LKRKSFKKVDHAQFFPFPVVGVDEVGRGCLAGPVYAAAVCFKVGVKPPKMTDSKLLSEKRRDEIAPIILNNHWFGIAYATVEEIDELNIFHASMLAMRRAILALEKQMGEVVGHILIDGAHRIPKFERLQTPLVKGDLRCLPISAASIIAKVTRDRLMKDLALQYPQYGFEKHKGYASEEHRKKIAEHGPTPHHRRTFSGVREYCAGFKPDPQIEFENFALDRP
jgi:ribonuclease HII